MNDWRPQGWDQPPKEPITVEVHGDMDVCTTVIADLELVGVEIVPIDEEAGSGAPQPEREAPGERVHRLTVIGTPQIVRDAVERIRSARQFTIVEHSVRDAGDGLDPRGYS